MNITPTIVVVLIGTLAGAQSFADSRLPDANTLRAQLKEFHANPKKVMNQLPQKQQVRSSKNAKPVRSKFSQTERTSMRFVQAKDMVRAKGRTLPIPGRAPINPNDLAKNLVDNPTRMLMTLEQMDQANLRSAELSESPWSDDYWAIDKGITARRYQERDFPNEARWGEIAKFFENNPPASSVDKLSPAEKYDLLIGASGAGSLRAAQIAVGANYAVDGKVETWMGICHGWAPAAYLLPRPAKTIVAMAADGKTKVRFLPADIKALASLLWANGQSQSRFIGGRCNVKKPKMDTDSGRVDNGECFDTNPGSWHLAIVNQIGVNRRSFVMDATYDYEVWNQPVHSYAYQLFNPESGEKVPQLEQAKIEIGKYSRDKFKKYRSKDAKWVVGVNMAVEYVAENSPSIAAVDSASNDNITRVTYTYDLELDRDGRIVGGEWYSNAHPDFLWTPAPGARATASGEPARFSQPWNLAAPMPQDMQTLARQVVRRSQPLGAVVEALVAASATAR